MKRSFTILTLLAISGIASAQPVITTSMVPFPVGTVDSIYQASASIAPGTGGANITWNFSTLAPTMLGVIAVVNPSSTPYISTFPSATICAQLTPTGSSSSVYTYERQTATKREQLANNYAGPGTGDDYTPNPESSLEFPMSYLNSFTDTFQKTGGSAYPVVITYDAYGTLITPFGTYTNVARMEKYWGPGDYNYNWYVTSPYIDIIVSYDASSNTYTFVKDLSTTAVAQVAVQETAHIFPNPFINRCTLKIDAINIAHASIAITDVTGKVINVVPVTGTETTISRDGAPAGLYFYSVYNNGVKIATGKLIIQ